MALGLSLPGGPTPAGHEQPVAAQAGRPARPGAEGEVFLVGDMAEEDRIALLAAFAASRHPGTLLLDSPTVRPQLPALLDAARAEALVPVGAIPGEALAALRRPGLTIPPAAAFDLRSPLWGTLFPRAECVVIAPAQDRLLLLQAACLAGTLGAPLLPSRGTDDEARALADRLRQWGTQQAYVAGAVKLANRTPGLRVVRLADATAVADCHLRHLRAAGAVRTLVVANPFDGEGNLPALSVLAPWLAVQKRAALRFTNRAGDGATAVIRAALDDPRLRGVETLLLVADLKAIPPERRPNPVPGKDAFIEMEPMTPAGSEPYTLATGRLFHRDRALVPLLLARQRLIRTAGPRKALIVSNPGGGLPLLETFSRNTAKELRNTGYETTALFNGAVSRDGVRRLLPEQDVFLWEGHHATMVRDYGMPEWTEPLPPALVFLQSCLALNVDEAYPFLQRGAVAVVGTSTRTYSASGGACSLAFFDALLYEGRPLGECLRQAKNFLLAYALLKEKRLGEDAKLRGANLRAAWAFTLWGDPTLRLPRPEPPADALPPVRHEVRGHSITLSVPERSYEPVRNPPFHAQLLPNARLAGLLHKGPDDGTRRLVPFLFAEVKLPKAPAGQAPRLSSRIPSDHWVFCWDGRRGTGYLLVTPRAKDRDTLRFHFEWEPADTVVSGE
jgi:Peptidase family C25